VVLEQLFGTFIEFRTVVKYLVSKFEIFTPFCYKFIHVTACKKIGILDLSLIKLLQNEQGCIFASQCRCILAGCKAEQNALDDVTKYRSRDPVEVQQLLPCK